jgi:hypothetical protein
MIAIIVISALLVFSFLFLSGIYLMWSLVIRSGLSLFDKIFLGVYLSFVIFVSVYFIYNIILMIL